MSALAEVETGALQGIAAVAGQQKRPVNVFHGVPYAAPPTGDLRFRLPQPVAPWSGRLDATKPGPVPMQALTGPYAGMIPGTSAAEAGEDCLTLEIWAPADASDLPVMVWVPGGAFVTGGASLQTYDGSILAADLDVVVVGVNYRLGAFGFAWLEELGGGPVDTNCGLHDQLAALEWVSRNIGAFGGDAGNITAFGESAGAGSLLHLLASTAAVPVRRAILQSPGVDHTMRADQGRRVTAALLRHLGDDGLDVARLRALPAAAILDAQEKTVGELMSVVSAMPFHPVVDGAFLPATPSVAFASGAAADIDLVVSWTRDEMRLFPNPAADEGGVKVLTEWTRTLLSRRINGQPDEDRVKEVLAFYQDSLAGSGPARPAEVWSAILTDGVMRLPSRRIADLHTAGGGTTYVTEFSWKGTANIGDWHPGAFHAIDLPFTFGTLEGCGWREFLGAGPEADQLSRAHMEAWASFARTGTPESGQLPVWPRYATDSRPTMVLNVPAELQDDPLRPVAEVWEALWTDECLSPTL
jgi:para-nitrobenzyl esterase